MVLRNSLLAASIVFLVINSFVVFLRVYVRIYVVRSFGWDDCVLLLTYIGFVISVALGFAAIHYGYAADDVQPWYDQDKATMFTYGNQTTLYISAGLVKLAVALVLLRITVQKSLRWVLILSIFVVGIWTVITVVFASWICATGGSSNWAGNTKCTDVGYFRTISNIFIDYFYALVPVYMLRTSQMQYRLKVIAVFLLGLGVFASSATIVKLVILVRLTYAKGKEADYLHYDLLLWADIELGIAIVAASAAALRPLLRHIPALLDTTYPQRSRSRKSGLMETGQFHEFMLNTYAKNKEKNAPADGAQEAGTKLNDCCAVDANSSDEELFRIT
ncbi:hypothetical protein GGS21DRAFT_541386 [Xylaria nigripes]|nr:hypothetical protein GGS21DRAFT_541386 [Xylaria nigripes]